jgi:hypothetical protein
MPQIEQGSKFGIEIAKLASKSNISTIVEIGSFDGLGSTLSILLANKDRIEQKLVQFVALEADPTHYKTTKNNLSAYSDLSGFTILNGIVTDQHFSREQILELINSDLSHLIHRQHFELWFDKEVAILGTAPNVLDLLPKTIDLLVLDGGEYSTYFEWLILKDRTNVFVLDDCNLLKCHMIRKEMLSDPDFELLIDDPGDRQGYCIFKRVKFNLGT